MVLSHLYVEGRTIPYRTPLRSPFTREADGRRSGSTALTTAIVVVEIVAIWGVSLYPLRSWTAPYAGCVDTDLPVGRCNYARSDKSVSETACLHHAMWVDHTETCCRFRLGAIEY